MPAVTFPTHPDREDYTVTPWEDGDGNSWLWITDKVRWESAAASGGGVTDHGALTGLADDDHTQYALADGSRGTFATAAQGTNERVPTAAGLTSKFGTAKGTLVDGDKLAILDSAASDAPKHGLLSALWTYIKAKIDAGLTIAGAQTFSGQVQMSAQAATDAQSAMSRGLTDARYGTPYNFKLTTDWSAATLANRQSTESIVVPAGTYEFEGCIYADTTSVTAGINSGFMPSNASADTTQGVNISGGSSSLSGVSATASIVPRVGSNFFQYIVSATRDGGASGKACFSFFRGFVTFSAEQTVRAQVSHRTATAATACVAATPYVILAVGTTDFTLIGAASNTVGLRFTASGAGTGTGTVTAPTLATTAAATTTTAGKSYVIDSVGTTDYTLIGAASNTSNLTFTATGAGTGTGMVSEITSAAVAKAGSFINFTKR